MILSIIGCGKVGQVLGRRFASLNSVSLGGILNRSAESTRAAAAFIGEGIACNQIDEIPESDIIMIATSDDGIKEVCGQLVRAGRVHKGVKVFHCSGAFSSELLAEARDSGAEVGSLHAMKSFADTELSFHSFPGTYCGIEGSVICKKILRELLSQSGANVFELQAETKMVYHAGAVFVCNYVTALLEAGLRCFESAGLDRQFAMELIEPFIRGTIDNNMKFGSSAALTGPIARGDLLLVESQLAAVTQISLSLGQLYRELGLVAVDLSHKQGRADPHSLAAMRNLFRG